MLIFFTKGWVLQGSCILKEKISAMISLMSERSSVDLIFVQGDLADEVLVLGVVFVTTLVSEYEFSLDVYSLSLTLSFMSSLGGSKSDFFWKRSPSCF